MSISLKKGSTFNLTKKEPALSKVMIGLGWEFKDGNQLDLDSSVFMLSAHGKLVADEYFVFYNNLKSPDGAVQHTGDNRTGKGDDDDEMILLNLAKVNPDVKEILITASIHDAEAKRHSFGLLEEAFIRIVDVDSNREILRYDLDAEFGTQTGVEFGKLYMENGEWHFKALGICNASGLQGFVDAYA